MTGRTGRRILSAPDRLNAVTVEQLNSFAQSNIVPNGANEEVGSSLRR